MEKHNKRVKFNSRRDEGFVGRLLYRLYSQNLINLRNWVCRLFWHVLGEHYQFYSQTYRKILKDFHGVEVGLYSHGGCCNPGQFPAGTQFGRYCSISQSACSHNANHPINTESSHAFFFNPRLGYVDEDRLERTKLEVGNDVWMGDNAIILPTCSKIGDGAVIGAGAVINKNVPPYAVVLGNPGRVVRYRFSKEKIAELLDSKWWEQDIDQLLDRFDDFQRPLTEAVL